MSIPLLARPNSIIAVGNNDTKPDYDFSDGVTLHVFELEDGSSTEAKIYNTAGELALTAVVFRRGQRLLIEVNGEEKPWKICLRGVDQIQSVREGSYEMDPLGCTIVPVQGAKNLEVEI